jgi:ABC-type sulfate/molybdate transport systems ATPase subunit
MDALTADLRVPLRAFDLALSLEVGGTVALVGPSGAGKSTVLRALAGLVRPAAGRITLGRDVWFDERTWRRPEERPVGMVFQHYALFPHLSVRDNSGYGLRSWWQRRVDPAARRRVDQLLELFELVPMANSRPSVLSGGQQQRGALAHL